VNRYFPFLVPVLFVLLACGASLEGAPPKLDWLYPAGAGPASSTTIAMNDVGAWPVKVWIDDDQGLTVVPGKEKNTLMLTTQADARPGVRWLRLYNSEGASSLRPLIIGSLPQVEEKEPNNSAAQAQPLADRVVISGRLEKNGDVDGFRVSLKRGQTLVASLTANEVLASPMDGVLQLCDAQGNVLTQSDDERGLDPQIVHEIKRDGDYIIRLFAFPATATSSISFAGGADFIYELTLTTGPFADHAMPLSAQRHKPATFTIAGWNLTDDTRTLALPPQSDQPITDGNVLALTHPSLANTIAIGQSTHATLVAQSSTVAGKAEPVTPPCIITGKLSGASHRAGFRFAARKGQSMTLKVESQSLGFPLDSVLTVRDISGKVLSETDDSNKAHDTSITFSPPADGEYEVMLRDLHDRGGFRFVYRLTIAPVVPELAITLERDSFVAPASAAVEIAVAIDRRNGFADDIEIRLEGLPEGVTAASVISKPKDATEKSVKLIVPASKVAWAGPVRVIALSNGRELAATFTALGESRHSTFWITLTAPGK